jgi:hypothetical protein
MNTSTRPEDGSRNKRLLPLQLRMPFAPSFCRYGVVQCDKYT